MRTILVNTHWWWRPLQLRQSQGRSDRMYISHERYNRIESGLSQLAAGLFYLPVSKHRKK